MPWFEMPLAPGRKEVQKNSNWRTPSILAPGTNQPVQNVPIDPLVGNGPTPPSLPQGEEKNVRPLKRQK